MSDLKKKTGISSLALRLEEEIRNDHMIRFGDRVIVGLSGGPDSVCLLSVLAELRPLLGIRSLHAVHVNHGLRGAESDADEAYAAVLAGQMGATFDAVYYNVREMAEKQGLSEEEAGRRLRYTTFELYRQKYDARRIAVAHNRNDQAETVMMRILRGTGLRGLAGIRRVREDGVLIRPLLGITREEIEAYCRQRNLTPRTDSSNLKPVYTRNRIRLNLFPLMEQEYNPRLQDALVRLAEQAAEMDDMAQQIAVRYLDKCEDGHGAARWNPEEASLDPEGFRDLHKAAAGRVLLEILERIGASNQVTSETIERLRRVALSDTEPMEADIHDSCYVRKSYGKLWFLRREQDEGAKISVPVPFPAERLKQEGFAEIRAGRNLIRLTVSERKETDGALRTVAVPEKPEGITKPGIAPAPVPQDTGYMIRGKNASVRAVMDLDCLLAEGVPVFRNRLPGDRFRPIGMTGRKKLQDYFTDRKIPRQNRDTILLLAIGNNVFCAGGDVGAVCKVTPATRRILTMEFERMPFSGQLI